MRNKYFYPIFKLKTKSWIRYWLLKQTEILPEGYTQLEYIESTGTQYIDTGIFPTSINKINLKVMPTAQIDNLFMGSRYSSQGNRLALGANYTAAGYCQVGFGNQWYYGNYTPINTLLDLELDYTSSNVKLKNNNKEILNFTDTSTLSELSNISLYLFGMNRPYGDISVNYGQCRIYNAQFYNGNTLVGNFIPCKNANNVVGLYDLVTKTFFQNAGTGEFVSGEEIKNG